MFNQIKDGSQSYKPQPKKQTNTIEQFFHVNCLNNTVSNGYNNKVSNCYIHLQEGDDCYQNTDQHNSMQLTRD